MFVSKDCTVAFSLVCSLSNLQAFSSSQTVISLRPFQQVVPEVPPQVLHLVIGRLFVFFSLFDQNQLLQKLEVFLLLLHLLGWLKTTSLAPVDCSGDVVNPSEGRWNGCPRRKELGLRHRRTGNVSLMVTWNKKNGSPGRSFCYTSKSYRKWPKHC